MEIDVLKYEQLDENEKILRNLHLYGLAIGELHGPPTGISSVDKNWLKYYSKEQIMHTMPHMTVYEYMMNNNTEHMNDIAIIYFRKKITYKRLQQKIEQCSKTLIANNIKKGDIVTVCMPNIPEAIIAFYAINKIGAVADMIHPLSAQEEIKNFVNESESKLIITIDSAYQKILNISDQTKLEKIVTVTPADSMPFSLKKIYPYTKNSIRLVSNEKMISWENFMNEGKNIKDIPKSSYRKDDLAIILHTGGTTGTPKGVMLSNDNFNSMVEQFITTENEFKRGEKMLTIMPVFHGFGLCSSVHLPLSVGVSIILIPKLNHKKLGSLFKKYSPNHLIGVPTLFKAILNDKRMKKMNLSFIKYIVSGGDFVKDTLEADVNNFLSEHGSKAKLGKGYGLSEAVAGVTFAYGHYNKPGSVGIPMVQTDIKIVSEETKKELPIGELGEICISSPSVMLGYYKNLKETLETIRNGYLYTGDIGMVDGNGMLSLVQRKGNMIVSSGVNVYPSNIEQVIEMHEAVASCTVIGIYHPYKLQVPKAFIVLKPGYEETEDLKEEINNMCIKNLNSYSIPYSYEFRKELPKTLLGKISYTQLETEEQEKIKIYSKEGIVYENSN